MSVGSTIDLSCRLRDLNVLRNPVLGLKGGLRICTHPGGHLPTSSLFASNLPKPFLDKSTKITYYSVVQYIFKQTNSLSLENNTFGNLFYIILLVII
jgi:hypothetical protein